MKLCFRTFSVLGAIAFATGLALKPAYAQQSSSVPNGPVSPSPFASTAATNKGSEVVYSHSVVRLLAAEALDGGWTAGVEIVMAPGWKTYWRVPGDAGVPSEFAWKNSVNVKNVEVSWPAPNRYNDITGKSTGYKKHVVFPVRVTPADTGKPAKLDLQLFYGICSDICIPATADLQVELPLGFRDSQAVDLVKEFASTVPRGDAKGVKVDKISALSIDGKAVLAVTLSGKVGPETDILVEGYDEAFFDAPKLTGNENGSKIYHLPVDGVENAGELVGKTLKLTVLSGEIRLETDVEVN